MTFAFKIIPTNIELYSYEKIISHSNDFLVGENAEVPDKCEIHGKVIIGHNTILHPEVSIPSGIR